jgi:hypothetical protein
VDRFEFWGGALRGWMSKPLSDFLCECEHRPSTKLGTVVSHKNAELDVVPLGTSTGLWMPVTGQRIETKHFSQVIFLT